jgi:hypothetical protein
MAFRAIPFVAANKKPPEGGFLILKKLIKQLCGF